MYSGKRMAGTQGGGEWREFLRSGFAAGSRVVDANANRYRCITELSTVRCVRDKVSPFVVRLNGPEARGETGRETTDTQRLRRPCPTCLTWGKSNHVYTDYLQTDEIKYVTRCRRTIIFSNVLHQILLQTGM